MAYSKRLTPQQYAEMKTRYQMGELISVIVKDYNYDVGNLQRRLQKDNVVRGELQALINTKMVAAAEDIKKITPELQAITNELQAPLVKRVLEDQASQWLGIVEHSTDIALKLNRNVLTEVSNRSRPGVANRYQPEQTAAILRVLGMTHDKLLEQTGIKGENLMRADNKSSKPLVINFNPVKKLDG